MLRVGVIGLGEVSQLMHLPILHDLSEQYKIVGVTDVVSSLNRFIGEKYNVHCYDSAKELVESSEIDCIFVLSPDQYHCQHVKMAIENGKHVFIEKPVALCEEDIHDLMEAERRHQEVTVMVGYMRRFSEPLTMAKEMMKDGKQTEYIRFRDIICEAPFYVGQTRPIRYPDFKEIPTNLVEEGRILKKEQLDRALGENATDKQRTAYTMLTGLGCHSFSAVRDLVGLPKKIASVTTNKSGGHMIVTLDYGTFVGVYELVNNQNIVQFDAAIEIFQMDRKIKVKYETPYIRYQPAILEVIESTGTDTKTIQYGPIYRDAFMIELKEFYSSITQKRTPMMTLEDSLQDLHMFKEIVSMVK